ncbi:hypothetical protein O7627_23810 [Solwaraspora sp. WMMD1047]|uniref:hypothetical protein n=1 Tax=Solwaraspora sp. WMMD1047 TaxID=3016102 RepID=UPI002415F4AB|nr:hypothetical protein [Solwaraspora sp. WMMD1047]MDG4832311.1 hypothetical protein [Solwaraspora sp. WMMD1047]
MVFGLMAWTGVNGIGVGAQALGVPMLITGAAGATGALIVVWSVLRPDLTDGQRPPARSNVQRVARIGMAVAAVATVAIGVGLAPGGWERGFVITVNIAIGGLLAVFALLAGEPARRRDEDRPQH